MKNNIEEAQRAQRSTRRRILAKLAELGVHRVRIDYDGCGDSGCIEAVSLLDANGNEMTPPETTVLVRRRSDTWSKRLKRWTAKTTTNSTPLREAIESWCYDLLEEHYPGWETDDGSSGQLVIEVGKKKATLEHAHKYTAYDREEMEV